MKAGSTILGLVLALTLAACSSTVTPQTQAVDYTKSEPFKFNTIKIDVVSAYQPRSTAPSVDHLMDKNPQAALVEWAKARMKATGTTGHVQVMVKDASVISRVLETEGGLEGLFTREGSEQLVANLEVEILAENIDTSTDARGQIFNGQATVRSSQIITVPEDATPDERKAVERDLLNRLMAEFDKSATAGIKLHLQPVLMR